jgi:hypothetical protein
MKVLSLNLPWFSKLPNKQQVSFVTRLPVCPACHAEGRRGDRSHEGGQRHGRSLDLSLCDYRGPAAAERSPFLSDELSAGSLGCGNDLVEAFITAQIIPAWIEAEIAV